MPEESLLQLVDPDKDVDGFHSLNIARLVSNQIIDYDDGEDAGEGAGEDAGEGDGEGAEKLITLVESNYSRDKEISDIQKDIVHQHHAQKGFYPCSTQRNSNFVILL